MHNLQKWEKLKIQQRFNPDFSFEQTHVILLLVPVLQNLYAEGIII